jgi:hypothetical protein
MRRRLAGALLLVTLGRLLSPAAVPVYDGIGQPDEPYRYVVPPSGAQRTAAPTEGVATSPVVAGASSYGLNVATAEQSSQFLLYVPPMGLAVAARSVTVRVLPSAPADQPPGAKIDGNVYTVVTTPARVTLTPRAAIAIVSMRATTGRQPPPVMEYRAASTGSWGPLHTTRGGIDVYFVRYMGAGQYALAFADAKAGHGGTSPLPYVLGGLLLLVVVVVVIRFRVAT